jgi:hypothetical protein
VLNEGISSSDHYVRPLSADREHGMLLSRDLVIRILITKWHSGQCADHYVSKNGGFNQ